MKKVSAWMTAIIMALGLGLLAPGVRLRSLVLRPGLELAGQVQPGHELRISNQHSLRTALLLRPPGDRRQGKGSRLQRPLCLKGCTGRVRTAHQTAGRCIPPGHRPLAQLRQPGKATFVPANRSEVTNVSNYKTFRQIAWAGSFEGHTSLGLGVRARLPFKVFTLAGPGNGSKLVIDVAHYW